MNNTNQKPALTETVIFLHIQKTAGTTLHRILDRQYPPGQDFFIKTANDYPIFQTFSINQRGQYRLIRGHMNFGIHKLLPNAATYFTILRDPIERAISYYYHIKNDAAHYNHKYANRWDLKEFLEQGVDALMANGQTRIWAGGRPDLGYGECTAEVLAQAKQKLQQYCAVVGLAERFDETLMLLKKRFGWRYVFYTPQNVSANRLRRHELSPDTLETVKKFNQLDIAFYQYGVSLFEEQVHQQGKTFSQQVKLFQVMNGLVVHVLPAYRLLKNITQRAGYKWTNS